MERSRVIVRWRAGPAWNGGAVRDAPGWDEHAAFIDDLVTRGVFVMGGPYADSSGSVSIWEGLSADEVRRIAEEDPFVASGVFVLEDVRDWTVFVDELTPRARTRV